MNFILIVIFFYFKAQAQDFPADWFRVIPPEDAFSWEILPQEARTGEVILSKRTELGVFSNFAATPFSLDGIFFASVEGLWQSLKYPEAGVSADERNTHSPWPFQRQEVEKMVSFEAKRAGDRANQIYRDKGFRFVSWQGIFFDYKDHSEGSAYHLELIRRALRSKLDQNNLWPLLLQTKCLKLRPDHHINQQDPPSFHYHRLLMELRSEKLPAACEDSRHANNQNSQRPAARAETVTDLP
jgi:hypothetical protein